MWEPYKILIIHIGYPRVIIDFYVLVIQVLIDFLCPEYSQVAKARFACPSNQKLL